MDETYLMRLQDFVKLIKEHQKDPEWTFELGRKYDKVISSLSFTNNPLKLSQVRYFVERSTGNIYGARSNTTPHLQWRFGNLSRCHLWDWSTHHPTPVNDPSARMIGKYGPYIRYISDEDA